MTRRQGLNSTGQRHAACGMRRWVACDVVARSLQGARGAAAGRRHPKRRRGCADRRARAGGGAVSDPSASVIINNYEYGRYLREAIDSALAQDHPATEVVVVDDGSTDDSASIIRSYGDRIVAVLKDNGGQGSAFNAGFAASGGDVIVFLDADDRLRPSAVRRAAERLARVGASKVHWPLALIDADGRPTEGSSRPSRYRPATCGPPCWRAGPSAWSVPRPVAMLGGATSSTGCCRCPRTSIGSSLIATCSTSPRCSGSLRS